MSPVLVRASIAAATCAAFLAACGADTDERAAPPAAAKPAAAKPAAAKARPAAPKAPAFLVFRRVRYEGATMRILTLRTDGAMSIDIPNGGAGGSFFSGRLKPRALRSIRRMVARTPWGHLSRRKVVLDDSGAYYMFHRNGKDYIGMASGMSPDLLPLVRRLNGVFIGQGVAYKKTDHRFHTP
jgi:hypothetical protein